MARPTSTDCPLFFTTYSGNQLSGSSAVAQSLARHTTASGIGKLTSNDCRRSASTIVRQVDPEMSSTIADHMNHSSATAARVYNIKNKDTLGVQAAEFMDDVYTGQKLRRTNYTITDLNSGK